MGNEIFLKENSKRLEIVPAPIVTADNFEGLVREELVQMGKGFFRLGYYLNEAKEKELYIPLGYDDVFEMAEDLFGFGQSSVYNYIAVWRRYHDVGNPFEIEPLYKGLEFRQLVECTRDKYCGVGRIIRSTDTVKETKAKVTAWNYLFEHLSRTPSLEEVEEYIERKKEERRLTEENSTRVEFSAPELKGQLPGQTSLFVEGYAEEPSEESGEIKENSRQSGKTEEETPIIASVEIPDSLENVENPFEGLPKETEIYADALVKSSREKSNGYETNDIVPADVQMRVHKGQAISYIEIMEKATYAEGVDHFFEVAIKRLVAMRACKLQALKGKKE